MSEATFIDWIDATRAQGDPAKYSKTDLEMFVMRVLDRFPFKAGKSQREKRRSFEETWEASKGNTEAVAYGFDAALKAGIYSMAYVKACIKNWALTSNYTQAKPATAPPTMEQVAKVADFKFSMPKIKPDLQPTPRKRAKKVEGPTEEVEWK